MQKLSSSHALPAAHAVWLNTLNINQSCIFRVVHVIKSLQDPLEVGNNLPRINDNVGTRPGTEMFF